MTNIRLTRKVWQNKGNKQLLITIPKNTNIRPGDTIEIKRIMKKIIGV